MRKKMDSSVRIPPPAYRSSKSVRKTVHEVQPLTAEEVPLFLAAVPTVGAGILLLFLCAIQTGMRSGELVASHWKIQVRAVRNCKAAKSLKQTLPRCWRDAVSCSSSDPRRTVQGLLARPRTSSLTHWLADPCPCSLRLRGATAFLGGRHHRTYRVSWSYLFCASSCRDAPPQEDRNQHCEKSIRRLLDLCRLPSENCRNLPAYGNGAFIQPSHNQQHSW
jgi:hypothetical protein